MKRFLKQDRGTGPIVTCCYNKIAYTLDPSTGTSIEGIGSEFTMPTFLGDIVQLSSTEAVVSGGGGYLSVISMSDGSVRARRGHDNKRVHGVAAIPSVPNLVASGGDDDSISLWDVSAGTIISKLEGHGGHVRKIIHHPNFLSPFLFSCCCTGDFSVRQWDIAREECLTAFPRGANRQVWGLALDPYHQILFAGCREGKQVEGWDYRSGDTITTLVHRKCIDAILFRENSKEYELVYRKVAGEGALPAALRSWAHGHTNYVLGICDVPDQDLIVTTGYSDYHARAWKASDGILAWDFTAPSHLYGVLSFENNYERCVSGSTPMGYFFSSDENRSSLIAEIECLHDVQIELSYGSNGESATFHCFQSLIAASSLRDLDSIEFGEVNTYRVIMDSDGIDLSEEQFLGLLLGTIEINEDFIKANSRELLDFCEILDKLEMKRMLWYTVECVREAAAESHSSVCFDLLKESFDRFELLDPGLEEEEEEEGESESNSVVEVKFRSVISLACFEALRNGNASRRMKRWLMSKWLLDFFNQARPQADLRSHHQLSMISDNVDLLPPRELLFRAFTAFAKSPTSPNVELISNLEGRDVTSVVSHVEALILSFDLFKMMLQFGGREREQFLQRRRVVVDGLSSYSLHLLSYFAYVGRFPGDFDVNESLLDVVLILRKAEEEQNQRLIKYCVQRIESVDSSNPLFLQSILNLGDSFEDVQCRGAIINSWAAASKDRSLKNDL